MLTVRQLPPEDWPLLIRDGIEPFASSGLPEPGHWIFCVAEEDGRIVGVSSLVETVHNHWFIHPDARRSPAIVTGLWRETKKVLDTHEVPMIHATVADSQPEVQAMVERLGYLPAAGRLYILSVVDAILNQKE